MQQGSTTSPMGGGDPTFVPAVTAMARWVEAYWNSLPTLPVLSTVKPGESAGKLPPHPPHEGGGTGEAFWAGVRADLDTIVVPGLTHWQHPGFFAYFPANISTPAIVGELLSAGLGVQGMLWLTSPACTEIETRVLDWLREMLGLPACFDSRAEVNGGSNGGGVIQGTASEATLSAMVAARDRARRVCQDPVRRTGPPKTRPEYTVYASTQAHSSIVKAAMIAGIADDAADTRHVRLIDVDDAYAMRTDLLEAALREDLAAGLVPCFVCANVGTTATTAMDPVGAIASVLDRVFPAEPRPWLHVDAAHAGAAAVCPEFRDMLDGVGEADSFCFNPHKWLLTNFDCDCFYVRDRRPLIDALSITPDYLRNTASDSGAVIDYRDWQIPLGRRFRALKLWFVIRAFGVAGLQAHIRRTVALAQRFENLVRADERFEIVAPRTVNLVCFRVKGSDDLNRRLVNAVNATGKAFLIHTVVPTRPQPSPSSTPHAARSTIPPTPHPTPTTLILRLAVGAPATQEADIDAVWGLLQQTAADLLGLP
jgi:aromatic-L-amino-acid decarboxylase